MEVVASAADLLQRTGSDLQDIACYLGCFKDRAPLKGDIDVGVVDRAPLKGI